MTRSQHYLIGAVLAFFGFILLLFRSELFEIPNRPRIERLLFEILIPYGKTFFLLLSAYMLANFLKTKWWIFILILLLFESVYLFMFYVGPKVLSESVKSSGWFWHFREIALINRSLVQYQGDTAQFDEELFYTLKPGNGRFKSFEFDTSYDSNSLGVRDEEASLDFPEVLFLGDSYSMGWGVEKTEAYPYLFRMKSDVKSLNTGVSSYGTARECRMMARVRVDSLKVIILQFSETDLEENHFYIENGRLGQRDLGDFEFLVKSNKRTSQYFPFKYISTAFAKWIKLVKSSPSTEVEISQNLGGVYSDYPNWLVEFYEIYNKIQTNKNVPLILTYIGGFGTDERIIKKFEEYAKMYDIKNIYFVNLGGVLDNCDYFFFDDHITPRGHQKVADELLKKYQELGFL